VRSTGALWLVGPGIGPTSQDDHFLFFRRPQVIQTMTTCRTDLIRARATVTAAGTMTGTMSWDTWFSLNLMGPSELGLHRFAGDRVFLQDAPEDRDHIVTWVVRAAGGLVAYRWQTTSRS
jgi:hypothetical protein